MSDYTFSRPSSPDAFAEIETEIEDSLTNPFEMIEVLPNIFISSWSTHLPSNITNSLNLTTKKSVGKNDPGGGIAPWHAPLKYEGDFSQSLPLILHAITDAVPGINLPSNHPKAILIYSEDGRSRARLHDHGHEYQRRGRLLPPEEEEEEEEEEGCFCLEEVPAGDPEHRRAWGEVRGCGEGDFAEGGVGSWSGYEEGQKRGLDVRGRGVGCCVSCGQRGWW